MKVAVGLEARFDTMPAYIADVVAARREAPADIEWPVRIGWPPRHPVLNVEAFVAAVDSSSRHGRAVARGLFDPSTYGTGTNPVVTDFDRGRGADTNHVHARDDADSTDGSGGG
eukprot:jgi/Tetstr1/431903/TSEL_021392.t1